VTLEELNRQATADTHMADESKASRVHLIVDLREAVVFPVNILSINAMVKGMLRHPKMGWVLVLANQNRLLRTLALMVPQVFGVQVKIFNHLHEAVEFIQAEDKSLSAAAQ